MEIKRTEYKHVLKTRMKQRVVVYLLCILPWTDGIASYKGKEIDIIHSAQTLVYITFIINGVFHEDFYNICQISRALIG